MSMIAYGAFALACVAGVMYLVQERQLKTHQLHSIFLSSAAADESFRRDDPSALARICALHGRTGQRIFYRAGRCRA